MRKIVFIVLVLAVMASTMAFQSQPVCKPWAHLVHGQCRVIPGQVKFFLCPKFPFGIINPKILKPWCR